MADQTSLDMVREWLRQQGWNPEFLEGRDMYRCQLSAKNGDISLYVRILNETQTLLCYGVPIIHVLEEFRDVAAEFVARANWGMLVGGFELDLDEGEIRFKSSLGFADTSLNPALIRNAVLPCLHTLDRYIPALVWVLEEGQDPAHVIDLMNEI